MVRHLKNGLIAGAMALSLAAPVMAADHSLNIYGASAQWTFWNDAANDFLMTPQPDGPGCASTAQMVSNSRQYGISQGYNCLGATDTVTIRYTSKASFDGIEAVRQSNAFGTAGCTDPGQRLQCNDVTSCEAANLVCLPVNVGASDVNGATFRQSSTGQLKGHLGGGDVTRSFAGVSTEGLNADRPIVVPFGFFVNNSVMRRACIAPAPRSDGNAVGQKAINTWGNVCKRDENGHSKDCIGYYQCIGGNPSANPQVFGKCSGGIKQNADCLNETDCPDVGLAATNCQLVPLDNITRLQAALIYSGQVYSWSQFGSSWYQRRKIVACLRHAGSGTHGTLDAVVMNNAADLLTTENPTGFGNTTVAWFNDGSSDMMKCIDQNGGFSADTHGAIGYADADQLADLKVNYNNVHGVNYEGVAPYRNMIANCDYLFWSAQWVFWNPNVLTDPTDEAIYHQLINFASDPTHIPATKREYWAAQKELKCTKATDFSFPQRTR